MFWKSLDEHRNDAGMIGEFEALIWLTRSNTWGASVQYGGRTSISYGFHCAGDARTWCEERISLYTDVDNESLA